MPVASHPLLAAARLMSLAVAPVCGVMVLVSATHHSAETAMCSNMPALPYLGSMGLMYALMGIFHISPWLTLLAIGGRAYQQPAR